jgi:hypothetical protein
MFCLFTGMMALSPDLWSPELLKWCTQTRCLRSVEQVSSFSRMMSLLDTAHRNARIDRVQACCPVRILWLLPLLWIHFRNTNILAFLLYDHTGPGSLEHCCLFTSICSLPNIINIGTIEPEHRAVENDISKASLLIIAPSSNLSHVDGYFLCQPRRHRGIEHPRPTSTQGRRCLRCCLRRRRRSLVTYDSLQPQ